VVQDVADSARDQRGVDYVQVFDATRKAVPNGAGVVEVSGWLLGDDEAGSVLEAGRTVFGITGDHLHVAVPIRGGQQIVGAVKIGLSLDDIRSDIAATQGLLQSIGTKGMTKLVMVSGIATVVFAALGILFSVAVARGISGPIERLVDLTRQIGRGALDISPPPERSDEIGELGAALVSMARDRKETEERARHLQADLAHVSRVSTMGEMATGLAHELNQPLTAIANYVRGSISRLRKSGTVTTEVLEAMDRAAAEALRAGEIIRRVRSFVQKVEPEKSSFEINVTIRETIDLLRAEAQNGGVVVVLSLEGALPRVLADKIQIQQVILNLVRNGIEAARDNEGAPRQVGISTAQVDGDAVRVKVRDSGRGVPADLRESIFDPFVTTKGNGLGMGLAICRSIIEAHNGRLEMTTGTDSGTTFQFTLPVVGRAGPEDASHPPLAARHGASRTAVGAA
jgi:C4-dicarboxylate-specific signal transduction histidine kinase